MKSQVVEGSVQKVVASSPRPSPRIEPTVKENKRPIGTVIAETAVRGVSISFVLFVLFAVYAGLKLRDQNYLTAETGTGYILGILGAGVMLALLGYPARKRMRFMSSWGPIKYWFQTHMIMGVLGPLCVLFHANFSLGSTNSNVALFTMLLVAGSGVFGRYIYTKIHYGLYGRRARLVELERQVEGEESVLTKLLGTDSAVRSELLKHSRKFLEHSPGVFRGGMYVLTMWFWIRWESINLGRKLNHEIKTKQFSANHSYTDLVNFKRKARHEIWEYLKRVRKVSEFDFHERVFSLWHGLHFPLFLLMALAGTFHVIAVHAF